MDVTQRLFGKKTIQDWIAIRAKIISRKDEKSNWVDALDLFESRLSTRYFKPIKRILSMRITTGEGFAVMALVCSLIEFLQSCYEGKSYQHGAKETKIVYGQSGPKFKTFLLSHEPFSVVFSKKTSSTEKHSISFADDFYQNVRCALLHEASTKNQWVIKTDRKICSEIFVDITDENYKIIYRENFVSAIELFIKNYCTELLNSDKNNDVLRDNFCRKLDLLCDIKDNAHWWL